LKREGDGVELTHPTISIKIELVDFISAASAVAAFSTSETCRGF
jgi:hypothetical protein